MISVLAVCDTAKPPSSWHGYDEVLEIRQIPPKHKRNLRLEVVNVSHWVLGNLNPIAHDLLDIAAFVYYADTSIKRGTSSDVFDVDWVRQFNFAIPVRRPDIWQQASNTALLIELLEFLTEDKFEFVFTQREDTPEQLVIESISRQLPPSPEADCVSLFSGGMDSLAGAVYLYEQGRKPILVSHRPRPVLAHLQQQLAAPLRERFPSWEFPHLGIWINRIGTRATEDTQRSRSFLFAALGTLLANQLNLNELVICENGITSFNLPRLGQVTGAQATRSTHPQFTSLFGKLAASVFSIEFKVTTPFLWKTRSEVLEILKRNGCGDLLPISSSCARSQRPKMNPHCGICSQCVDRRFAVTFSGLDSPDELHGYEKDIFTHPLNEGQERLQATSTVHFALDVQRRDLQSFCEKYPQVYDAVFDVPSNECDRLLKNIYDLHVRFANEIDAVMGGQYAKNWGKIVHRDLPEGCLLMIISPNSSGLTDISATARAEELVQKLRNTRLSKGKPLEDVCEEILTFLFCDGVSTSHALKKPDSQSKTDYGYRRRDLLFENRAIDGFWAEVRRDYAASGVVADAKNYKQEISGDIVSDFASKYLKDHGVGRFGLILARKVPEQTRRVYGGNSRLPAAIEEQKNQWRENYKMIILLGEDDLSEMLGMKGRGQDPTELFSNRVFTLKARM